MSGNADDGFDEEMAQLQREMASEEAAKRGDFTGLKLSDALMCHERGEWDTIPPELRRRYIGVMRRAANPNTFTTQESRDSATAVLSALGLPLESEKAQRAANKTPLTDKEISNIEKSRRKLVDRQKRLLMNRFADIHADGMITVQAPGPYQEQAVNELLTEGQVVLIRDDEVQLLRGAKPRDGSPRRKRRVILLGLPFDEEASRKAAQEPPRPIPRSSGTAVSYPHTPGLWPDEPAPEPAETPPAPIHEFGPGARAGMKWDDDEDLI